jgi:RNA polymerase sigma factor (sigma-70 family)
LSRHRNKTCRCLLIQNSRLSLIVKHKTTFSNEQELIERCIKEDRVAQHALFSTYGPVMLGVCYRYAHNREEAEDMMQEGFVLVFNNIGRFRQQSSLKTWITRIMINSAINYLRKHHKISWEHELDDVADELKHSDIQLHGYDSQVVMGCIQELPLGYRMVLNLYAMEGYSHKEIAEQLKIKEATSRSQYAKAKTFLQKLLSQKGIVYNLNEARGI